MHSSITRRQWMTNSALAAAALGLKGRGVSAPAFAAQGSAGAGALSAPLHANENPYGPCEAARRAIAEAIVGANRYVELDGGTAGLKALIASREGLTPDHVVLGAGSSEVLHMVGLAYGLEGGEVLTADPTFGLLARYAAAVGGRVHRVPLNENLEHDLPEMDRRVTQAIRLVYVCNPNNPTGTLLSAAKLRPFCETVSRRSVVFVDEAYMEYVDPAEQASMIDLVRAGANVIIARTFSKIYGLAGLRVGYGLARPDLIARIGQYAVGNLNKLGCAAAVASYQDREFVETSRRRNAEARAFTLSALDAMGIKSAPSHGNYLYVRVGAANSNLPTALAKRGVRVNANGAALTGEWMRVTVGTMDEMKRFVAGTRESLGA